MQPLYHRKNTKEGQFIDISLLDCLVSYNGLVEPAGLGKKSDRTGNHHSLLSPFGLFRGRHESMIICAPNPKLWALLCEVMGRQEMLKDPFFATGPDRANNLGQLVEQVEAWLKEFPTIKEPLALLEAAGIPCAKVNTTADLLEDEHLKTRGIITELETPDGLPTRSIKSRGNPFKFSNIKPVLKKAPNLGQHQDELLQSAGYDDAQIDEFKKRWKVS